MNASYTASPAVKVLQSADPDVQYQFNPSSRLLGEGGMGYVYVGKRISKTEGTRDVAIKRVKPEIIFDKTILERARREGSLIIVHQNLVRMYDFIDEQYNDVLGRPQHDYYVISELLMGVSLADLLEGRTTDQIGRGVPVAVEKYELYRSDPFAFAKEMVTAVLNGLISLHQYGYIHRDIDPSNIIITTTGEIKLIDFGIAKRWKDLTQSDNLTHNGVFLGKPLYASPEQIRGRIDEQGPAADIYSVGIMLFHLIVGHPPYQGTSTQITEAHCKGNFPVREIPRSDIAKIIKRACAHEKGDRYQSAAEFFVELNRLPAVPPKPAMPNWLKTSIGAACILILALIFYKWLDQEPIFEEAKAMLAEKSSFDKGLEALEGLALKNDLQAIDLLSTLYVNPQASRNDPLGDIRKNAQAVMDPDSTEAHKLRKNAIKIDNENFSANINLAEDYINGIGCQVSQSKAKEYLEAARELANTKQEERAIKRMEHKFQTTFSTPIN